MRRFKVGDKVALYEKKNYLKHFNSNMKEMAKHENIMTVKKFLGKYSFTVEENGYAWFEEDFCHTTEYAKSIKVGDKVRVVDGSNAVNYRGGWVNHRMGEFVGKVFTVVEVAKPVLGKYGCYLDGCEGYIFDSRFLDKVDDENRTFKKGDTVKVIGKKYFGIKGEKLLGKVGKVVYVDPLDGGILCSFKGFRGHTGGGISATDNCWWLLHEDLEFIDPIAEYAKSNNGKRRDDSVRIHRLGNSVVAESLVTGKTGVAKCHPDDEFDFAVGAKLAIERLYAEPVEEKKPLNCKFVVIDGGFDKDLKNGKVYEVVDGYFDDETLGKFPIGDPLMSFEELEEYLRCDNPKRAYSYAHRMKIIQIVE